MLDDWSPFEHSPIAAIHLWFDRPVTSLPHGVLLDSPFQWFFSKDEGRYIQLVVSAARFLQDWPRDQAAARACEDLTRYLPEVRAARLLSGLAPDLEMALTPYVGMLAAHQVGRLWRGMRDELRRFADHRLRDEADYLRDEASLAPHRAELEPWFDAVDRVRDEVDALEARIRRLGGVPR